jgi:NADPH:quinone reductase-like Zn-dependent oxidoreductase
MHAAYAVGLSAADPLSGLRVGDVPAPPAPQRDWVPVTVRAVSVNHHDIWSLRGYGLSAERLPMILGCDAAGVLPDGTEVIVHAGIGEDGGRESLLSERHPGTFAERVWVPAANLVPKPPELSFEEAACLPIAYLTAYAMLFGAAELRPGDSVLVQGAGGGVATAAIILGAAAGVEVHVSSRRDEHRRRALALGARSTLASGDRLPQRVDAVLETVGEATFAHSLRSVRDGGRIVVAGGTSGLAPTLDLAQVFMRRLRIQGVMTGSVLELAELVRMLIATGARPLIDSVLELDQMAAACARMLAGDVFGKLVIRV